MTSKQNDGPPSREEDKREKDTMKEDESDASENSGAAKANPKNKSKRKSSDDDDDDRNIDDDVPLSFPQRMMEMLSDESHSDIVCWLPHGKGFVILDKKRFAHEVMPKYFNRRAKFTSFTRKLNRWSFTRVTRGPENGAYYHPLFQKNNLRLCLQMSCINSKSNQAIQPMNPVALGMGPSTFPPGMMAMMPGNMAMMNDPQKFFQQELQNQRFMSMAGQPPAVQGQASSGDPSSSSEPNATSTDVSSSDNNGANAASMAAFQMQQRQYYAMLMAQQQQMAAMAASNPAMMAQQQQMFQQQQQQQQALMAGAVETGKEEETKDAVSIEAGASKSEAKE